MADVYLAWDKLRAAKMAVKVLKEKSKSSPRSFAREAEVLRKLEHPNIVRIYEYDADEGVVFFVMDWVEGNNLGEEIQLRKTPFSPSEAIFVIRPVCSAVNFANQRGVFHCDIKPKNILLHVDGRVLLSDFGVAQLKSEARIGGTPPYMAPEQLRGDRVDARTDVYGLGISIFEMLSGGELPYKGDTPHSQSSTLNLKERIEWELSNLPLPAVSSFNPQVTVDIERVISKALEISPEHRYPSVVELRDDFEKFISIQPTKSRKLTTTKTNVVPTKKETPTGRTVPRQKGQKPTVPKPARYQGKGPYLLGRASQFGGKKIHIPKEGLTVGRSSQKQMIIRDRSVSRNHATIYRSKHGVSIQDDGSKLGTYVNGHKIYGPVRLRHGDIIRIGYQQEFEFHDK